MGWQLEDMRWVEKYLAGLEYDDYDRLIQLCDAVSMDTGYWLIEKRLLDVGIRRGVTKFSPQALAENARDTALF